MIVDPLLFLAFLPAALVLVLLPGPDMLFALAQGLRGGPRRALAAAAGASTGSLVNFTLAGLGLGAVIAAFPGAFDAIRWIGAAYLLWIAWKTWRTPLLCEIGGAVARPWMAYREGIVVNVSNPKVILFILALIPQYVDPGRPVLPQFLAMGAVIALGGVVVNGAVGWFAGRAARWLLRASRAEVVLRRAAATLFGALALRLGWEAARG